MLKFRSRKSDENGSQKKPKITIKKIFIALILICAVGFIVNCLVSGVDVGWKSTTTDEYSYIQEDEEYSSAYDVAEYINTYYHLPSNYMSKAEAAIRGWRGGNPQNKIEGNVYIGGDKFKNREGLLPDDESYYECDVDYYDDTRGENRLIYTKDGKVYYTYDHYESFEQLY